MDILKEIEGHRDIRRRRKENREDRATCRIQPQLGLDMDMDIVR